MIIMIGLTSYRLDRIENLEISQSDAIDAVEKIGPNPELIIRKYIEESVNHFLGETVRIEVEYKTRTSNKCNSL